jgi:DNA polymerase-3 subunit alpha
MKNFMKELKPRNLEDVIAGISLYRPGPMDFIPLYIKGKEHPEEITYDHPALEKILAPTYGCIVYQEQVMQIVMELAGYTMGRSDLVRRAMSKKKAEVMQKEREYFVYGNDELGVPGCVRNGIDADIANKIFDEMTDFARYAFNKSHAAAYAVVAYQTAYLKCHYPKEFMAALMSSVKDNTAKVSAYIQSCRQMGIRLLPPDVNRGYGDFSVSDGAIRYGLSAIKSIGDSVVEAIIKERETNGLFLDLKDFINRMSNKEANKRTIENFIYAGAFDGFGLNRKVMILVYPTLMEESNREKKSRMTGQMSLMDFLGQEEQEEFSIVYPEVEEYDTEELLNKEKEVLGVYASGHPLVEYADFLEQHTDARTIDFIPDEETQMTEVHDQIYYTIGGTVEAVTVKTTKKGDSMAFVTLEDLYGTVEVVVFPKVFQEHRSKLVSGSKLLVTGRASVSEETGKLLATQILSLDEVRNREEAKQKQVWILFRNEEDFRANEKKLAKTLAGYPGDSPVYVQLKEERQGKALRYRVDVKSGVVDRLKQDWGDGRVIVRDK